MEFKKAKVVRFYNDEQQSIELSWGNDPQKNIEKPPPVYQPSASLMIPKVPKFGRFTENYKPGGKRILDPGSDVFLQWNRVFLFWCLVALFVDPLFFYLPSVVKHGSSYCMYNNYQMGLILTCFRTFADIFHGLNIVIKFRTAYVSPSSRVFGKGELVMDPMKIATRYIRSNFCIDLAAALPLPQIVIWFVIPTIRSFYADYNNDALILIVLLQYIPRFYLIFPLSSQIIKATGVVTRTAWAGAAYNLVLYMLASHILGASWYVLSIERQATCWKSECRNELTPLKCYPFYLSCDTMNLVGRMKWENSTLVFDNCDPKNKISFQHGIFKDALTNDVASSAFLQKYFYSFWWGLQNLSSYGQTLATSTFIGETLFAILIAILGLVLFAHLIGNMQTYLQSITVRLEEWRLKERDTEEWMRHRQLPQYLRQRVRRFVHYKWLATRGVDEESILRALPTDLFRDIQRHLCLDLVRRVPFFSKMDDQLLDAICEHLVSSLSPQGTCIVREDDPVTEMLFIIRGRLESSTTNGGRTGFFNSITLGPGDFCGEELLPWALVSKSTVNLPSSTRTVRALGEVEAFALRAEHLKFVSNQFRRLHSKKLQHTFRLYSHHWRTWAACFIQAAWRRYIKRKLAKNLSMLESFSYTLKEQVAHETDKEQARHSIASSSSSQELKKSQLMTLMKPPETPMLEKPEEPDFSAEPDDIDD